MKKVLLVEDKQQLADLYMQKLSQEFEVTHVAEGEKVMETAKEFRPSLIILDLILPGEVNGYDIVRQLKRDPETQDIPVMIYTSLSKDSMPPTEGEEKLIAGYLDKSATEIGDLIKKVKQLID